ncbi:unnamed protein product [Rhizophagus irregularis]|nr:unnamed protein product [Rhizophagus irregularis]
MVGRGFSCNADASDWLRVFLVEDSCESVTRPLFKRGVDPLGVRGVFLELVDSWFNYGIDSSVVLVSMMDS